MLREAAHQIRDVYDATGHLDGFVSFELPPGLANDSAQSRSPPRPGSGAGSIAPNIFIKIPVTAEGASPPSKS